MLSAALLIAGTIAAQSPTAGRAEAERLARAGSHEEALQRFRDIAAENPDDLEARVWIGRLHLELGHAEEAARVFASIITTTPNHVGALLGLGRAHAAARRFDEAVRALDRAEKLAPENPDVLAVQGDVHATMGHTTLALAYYERASLLRPDDRALEAALARLRRAQGHRLEGAYVHESFSEQVTDTRHGDLTLDLRVSDAWRLFGRVQTQRKFGRDDARFGGGGEWRVWRELLLRGQAMVGDNLAVLPERDGSGELVWMRGRVGVSGIVRYARFRRANFWIVSPGVTFTADPGVSLTLRYVRTNTYFEGFAEGIGDDGAQVRVGIQALPRVFFELGYARGLESFDALSVDRIGTFDADTVSGGTRLDFRTTTSLFGRYEHQWRTDDRRMLRITGGFAQRF